MDRRSTTYRITLALALLPIVVVAYGLGLPFEPSVEIGVGRTSYHLIILGLLAVAYAILLRISERGWAKEREAAASMSDEITGLPAAQLFRDRLQQAILIAERDDAHVPVIVMGVDRFGEVNQAFGRDKADQILVDLASRLTDVLRDSDSVARIGGDEFALLLPSASTGAGAVAVVHKIREALTQPFAIDGFHVELAASFGIALSPGHGRTADDLLRSAACAMASAKRSGARFEMFSEDRHDLAAERVALVAELRQAIEDHQLILFYQPKQSLNGGGVKGVEALVRWMHPERGLVPPDVFIPMAEQTELMTPLTLYVLEEAIRQLSEWRLRGLDINVAVNVSARNLTDENLPHNVQRLLRTWSVPPEMLELEVTESMVIDDQSRAMLVLETLSQMGVRIAIDDYGAGFTSLTYLTKLPINALKIDKSFVQNMIEQRRDNLVVRSTIDLGRNLELDVVAEGVETEEVWNQLSELGCDYAQGYFVSKPLPASELSFN